ncbi:MAG: zinc-dependent metalloprotease [Kiritimatiellaeota bacterium]|nr:zinc-dependent metalloprotease [Kiritimatiellota bacterium]
MLVLSVMGVIVADAATHEMFLQGDGVAAPVRDGAPDVLRARHGRPAQRVALPVPQDEAIYPFFADAAYTTTVARVTQGYGGTTIVQGEIPETHTLSLSIYSAEGERHEVHFTDSGRVYVAATLPDGTLEVREHDPSLEPRWDEHAAVDAPEAPQAAGGGMALAAGNTEIDVMIVFDTTAATWANSSAGGVETFAESAVQRMNTALANSGIACTMRLVGTYCPSYTYAGDFSTALSDVTYGRGALSGVAAERNACGADVVSMMVDTGSAFGTTGMGWVSPRTASYAFSVCSVRAVNTGHTMSHEIGHNLGCGHSKTQASSPGPTSGIPYAAGWYFTGNNNSRFHTVMAYNHDGSVGYQPCNYFSTPLVTYQSVAVGDAADGDNARCFRENMTSVAAYRPTVVSALPIPTGVAASQGTYADRVSVSWSAVSGAVSYKVFRNTADNSAGATQIGTPTATSYNDTTVVKGVTYHYWVKAVGGSSESGFSAPAQGWCTPFTLGEALNNTTLSWSTGGHTPHWHTQAQTAHDGLHAAQSGKITHSQTNWVETTVTGPGTLTFWWRVSSENGYDWLTCTTNSVQYARISGPSGNWEQRSLTLPAGTHAVRWAYSKDGSVDSGLDCGWLDEVTWTPAPAETQTTPVPVPHSWLDQWGGTPSTYEALANSKGANGYYVWESFVAGLVPTNQNSRFTARICVVNGQPQICWHPDLEALRVYTLFGNATLDAGGWTEADPQAIGGSLRFFKVSVDLLPEP